MTKRAIRLRPINKLISRYTVYSQNIIRLSTAMPLSPLLSLLRSNSPQSTNSLENMQTRIRDGALSSSQTPFVMLSHAEVTSVLGLLGELTNKLVISIENSKDLCIFCRNNNEPREVYLSHKQLPFNNFPEEI
ncbi:hypothetical protein Ciccas_001594 [Cichlidogyrus casuarinus]|uniref:Uncharacterized protein n=1 Tax=Cichlidogyrus casuarinus TaxID=1844966 RepID=A0ABD2QJL8_9PLAT